jgi:ABC-type sugar transport system ATPase subunit
VTKRFGGAVALAGVDFDLRAGEVHALLGENGAGKSTLIKILAGVHPPDAGQVFSDGRPVCIDSVADADRLGIRVIHQELSLAPNLSVAENIYLGREPRNALGLLSRRRMERDARALVETLGLHEVRDVRAPVSSLSVAHRQLVEIARALSRRARVLILDEPTSSLSEAETEALFATLARLKAQGVGIVYISHRLEEIIRLADRITVLRDGKSIGTQPAGGFNQAQLVRWMVGRDISDHFHRPAQRVGGGVVLEVVGLEAAKVRGVSFQVRHGEILGLAGLVGSGRTELARAIFGIDPIRRGEVRVDGRPVRIRDPRDALAAGIVLVPEDRKCDGLVMMQSVAFNLALPWVDEWSRGPLGVRQDRGRRRAIVERAVRSFGVRLASPQQPVSSLSGGNQQKALVGRWMERRPKVLILDEPTRGVDVGAREEMFAILSKLVEDGMAVLLISSDLAEVMNLSHRVALYRDGRIVDTFDAGAMGPEDVMRRLAL